MIAYRRINTANLDTTQKVPPTLDTAQTIPATLDTAQRVPPALDTARFLCSVFICVLCYLLFRFCGLISVEPLCGRVWAWGRRAALVDEAERTRNSEGRKRKGKLRRGWGYTPGDLLLINYNLIHQGIRLEHYYCSLRVVQLFCPICLWVSHEAAQFHSR